MAGWHAWSFITRSSFPRSLTIIVYKYIAGDEGVYGRVYLTTGGRGYIYGDPQ